MSSIRVAVSIGRSPSEIWDYVGSIESHTEWMADAESITFTTEQTSGVGTTFDCLTKVGPLGLVDTMTITRWEPGVAMGVDHVGLVTGTGVFELHPVGANQTVFSWTEQLRFPLALGGPITAVAAKPVLRWIWRRNLDRLKDRLESRA